MLATSLIAAPVSIVAAVAGDNGRTYGETDRLSQTAAERRVAGKQANLLRGPESVVRYILSAGI